MYVHIFFMRQLSGKLEYRRLYANSSSGGGELLCRSPVIVLTLRERVIVYLVAWLTQNLW